MCPCGDFLEIYKIDKTFRVKTPETIDPNETNPNAPWVISSVSDAGSSNPIVARVLLQGYEILKVAIFDGEINKSDVIKQLHGCKEAILACERMARTVGGHIDRIISDITEQGITRDNHGQGLNPFPQVPDLDTDCGTFLIQVKRTIKLICELAPLFINLKKPDSNFDSLLKSLSKNLAAKVGEHTPLVKFITESAPTVRYLINLRNFHEHPGVTRTIINNFQVLPSGQIACPTWQLSGIEDTEPHAIKEEMFEAIDFLIQIAEAMLIHLVLHRISQQFPFIVQEIPDEEVDSKRPIRFQLSIDMSKLHLAS